MAERKLVSVVDDDESIRESLPDLLRSYGFDVQPFACQFDGLRDDVGMNVAAGVQVRRDDRQVA